MSTKAKLTPWFDGPRTRPVREGVYETGLRGFRTVMFQWWHMPAKGALSGWWGLMCHTPQQAYEWRMKPSGEQNRDWRGLAEGPQP